MTSCLLARAGTQYWASWALLTRQRVYPKRGSSTMEMTLLCTSRQLLQDRELQEATNTSRTGSRAISQASYDVTCVTPTTPSKPESAPTSQSSLHTSQSEWLSLTAGEHLPHFFLCPSEDTLVVKPFLETLRDVGRSQHFRGPWRQKNYFCLCVSPSRTHRGDAALLLL